LFTLTKEGIGMNLNNSNSQKIAVIILSVILFSSIPVQTAHAVGFSFTSKNISNDSGSRSLDPQVAVSGDDIYVIWRNSTSPDIYFSSSDDGGTSFSTPTNLSSSGTVSTTFPQISSDGTNVYAVWNDEDDVVFIRSTNSGNSFESTINLSNSGTDSAEAQISSTGNNVFVAFSEDETDVFLSSSINSGSSFASPVNLSNSAAFSFTPQISTSGSDAFVVWDDEGDISFIKASESGGVVSLDSVIPLSSSGNSAIPQIASSGSNVFVVWEEGDDIVVSKSTDSGATFSSFTDIGDTGGASAPNPQIVMSGDNAHVVWRDDTSGDADIMFSSSIGGAAFTVPENLSDNVGASFEPQIAASGSNVYVTWRDNDSGNQEIIFQGSDDDGVTFTEISLSGSLPTDDSDDPQIAISGSTAHIVWEEDSTATPEIFHSVGVPSEITISFEPSDPLRLGETVTITVTNSEEAGSIDVNVKSSTGDTTGFDLSLEKISETHSGTLDFSETLDSSQADRRLKANPGDTITVTFGASEATTTIIPRTISVSSVSSCLAPNDDNKDDIPDYIWFEVNDENSNTDIADFDTVTVQVTSLADPSGISLTLTETGVDTGIFGGESSSPIPQLVFFENEGIVPQGRTVTITQEDPRPAGPDILNKKADAIDFVNQTITSTSDAVGVEIELSETGIDTGVFTGRLVLSNVASNDATDILLAPGGDIITVIAPDDSNGPDMSALITPADPSQGAIKVDLRPDPGKVVASLGVIESSTITVREFCGGAGGGGGGLVRPSLVLNVLAGLGGGGSAYSSPTLQLSNLVKLGIIDVPLEVEQMIYSHDSSTPTSTFELGFFENFDYPLIINDKGFVLSGFSTTIETQTLQTNTPHTFKFLYYEGDKIQHFSLYTNLRGANTEIHQSDTQILYNDGGEIYLVDPNGFFENIAFTLNELDDIKKEIVLEITFAKEMATTDMIVRSWDPTLNSFDTYILDAFKVVSDTIEESSTPTFEAPVFVEIQSQGIPKWIKNNAAWWSDQQISDSDFVSGIEYLIKNGIINVPGVEVGTSSASTEIPDWIQNNAGWWAESLITDGDFVQAMQWLIANGVIQI